MFKYAVQNTYKYKMKNWHLHFKTTKGDGKLLELHKYKLHKYYI